MSLFGAEIHVRSDNANRVRSIAPIRIRTPLM